MPRYCLDADVLIQAKNGPYGFDIAPGFWAKLDELLISGALYSSRMVYDEIAAGNDELAEWVKARKTPGFIQPSTAVQTIFRDIADYVNNHYSVEKAEKFLSGADPWIIAHAKADSSIVVTMEKLSGENAKKVKIPNICVQFGVLYIDTYKMLRETGAFFERMSMR